MSRLIPPQSMPTNLSKQELIFNKTDVPDAEVRVCCLWEYARESKSLRSMRERSRQYRHNACRTERDESVRMDFYSLFHNLGRKAILFQEGFYGLGGANGCDDVSPFPQPWHLLSPEMRSILIRTAEWTPEMLMEKAPFRWANAAYAFALAKQVESSFPPPGTEPITTNFLSRMGNLNPEEARKKREEFLWENRPRSERPSWMYPNGHETLMIEIDWGRFNNEQIIACFRKWVGIHRPKEIKAPSTQGHKESDWRAALSRLGIMRALNAFTLADVRFPRFLKGRDEKAYYAARKEAGKTFRRLFPFLPRGLPSQVTHLYFVLGLKEASATLIPA